MTIDRAKAIFVALAFGLLAAYPLMAGSFGIDLVTKIMVYAVFALSLELLVGTTGLVCFGQAAFFGIGAYATVMLSAKVDTPSLWWLLPACVAARISVTSVRPAPMRADRMLTSLMASIGASTNPARRRAQR